MIFDNFLKNMHILSKGKKTLIFCSLLMPIISCFLVGISASDHSSIRQESLSASVSELSKSNLYEEAYLKFDINDDNGESNSRKIYSYYWRDNFNYASQLLCLSSPGTFEPSKFKLTNNSFCLSEDILIADAYNYSSQQDLLRFETIRMNLYKYRERKNETEYVGYDGFIYLPDFIADSLIEHSDGLLKYYDDLLIDGQIPDNLIDYLTMNLDVDGRTLKFRIANIFHVDGYNEDYILDESNVEKCLINDGNTGKKYKTFIGDFCVAYSYQFIQRNDFCLVSIIGKKPYTIIDYLSTMSQQSNYKLQGYFYTVTENDATPILLSSDLFATFNYPGFSTNLSVFFLILSIFFFVNSIIMIFICDRYFLRGDCLRPYHLIHIITLSVAHALLTILSVFMSNNFIFNSIYSKYFGLVSILILIFEVFMLIRTRRNR